MEAVLSEYAVCVIEAVTTMFFCLYVVKDRLTVRRPSLLYLGVAGLALAGSAASMVLTEGLGAWLPYDLDYSMATMLPWIIVGYFCLRAVTHEPTSRLIFLLLLSLQILQLCLSVTLFVYGLFFPALTSGNYCWGDILGYGIPSILLTPLLALFCRRLYQQLQGLKEYTRLWVIPLFFVLLYVMQVNLYPIEMDLMAYAVKILITLCAFLTYSQMVSAISNASKVAREMETRIQLAHQLELQRARVEDLESHAEEMKRIRHDRRQHVRVLRGLLEKDEVREGLTYLDDYEGSMAAAIQPPLCENFVVDTLCRRYEALAKQSGIDVDISLTLPPEPGVSGSDLPSSSEIYGRMPSPPRWTRARPGGLSGCGGRFRRTSS